VALHRQYVRPICIDVLSDECKEISGIDETLLFSSELDLDGALRKVIIIRCFDKVVKYFMLIV
jgi:hypothetical protein